MRNLLLYWLIVGALAAAAAVALRYGFKAWRESRMIEDTPTSRVRSAAQGYVQLAGTGSLPPKTALRGPLTGKPCTWWRYEIEERSGAGRSITWLAVDALASETPFELDDGSGKCLVDPRGAKVLPHAKNVWYGPDPWPQVCIPDGTGVFGRLADLLLTDRYRYSEFRLQEDEPLYAIGEFRTDGGAPANDPEIEAAALLHDWKQDQANLLRRFDTDRDGVLSPSEWESARAAAREQALADASRKPPAPAISVLADPGDGRAFLLAADDRASVARKFRRLAFAAVIVFLGTTAAAAWMLTVVR